MPGIFKPEPNENVAYHCDGTHEYFGYAPEGATTSKAVWQIFKMEYTTAYNTAGSPWIIKWAEGTDQFTNIWDNVATLNYYLLGRSN